MDTSESAGRELQKAEHEAERQQQALNWFDGQFKWYARHAKKARRAYTAAQGAAIVLSAVTPVIVVVESLPVAVRGIPAVIATIALAASNLFAWRENWARYTQTAGALERERLWFDTRTGPYAGVGDANARFALARRPDAANARLRAARLQPSGTRDPS